MQKLKHIIYKEWIKTRWFVLISAILTVSLALYISMDIWMDITKVDTASYIANLTFQNVQIFGTFKLIPILIALLIGLSQFIPEVIDKRIKLSLHLPIHNTRMIYTMVLYGFCVITSLLIVASGIMTVASGIHLPLEIVVPALMTLLPWCLGGLTTYFLVAMIALEPQWKFRVGYTIFAYFLVSLFMKDYGTGNATTLMPILYAITLMASLSILYTSHRFNKGEL